MSSLLVLTYVHAVHPHIATDNMTVFNFFIYRDILKTHARVCHTFGTQLSLPLFTCRTPDAPAPQGSGGGPVGPPIPLLMGSFSSGSSTSSASTKSDSDDEFSSSSSSGFSDSD